eukprot:scaffold15599_cov129-Skeletonema_dohrnii-CCMP3373.AAC.3
MAAVNTASATATATLDMLVCHGAGIFRYDATIMLSSAPSWSFSHLSYFAYVHNLSKYWYLLKGDLSIKQKGGWIDKRMCWVLGRQEGIAFGINISFLILCCSSDRNTAQVVGGDA